MIHYLFLSISLAETPLWVYAASDSAKSQLQEMPLGFTEQARDGWLRMDAEEEGIDALRMAQIPFTIAPSTIKAVPEGYHSPEDINQALVALSEAHPNRSELVSLGYSVEGREILALRVGNQIDSALAFRILGAHHGDELPSGELVLAFADSLLNNSDTAINTLLDDAHIWLVPHVNPDGVEAVRRYNANNVDLNRNYGFMWNPNEFRPGSGPFSEPETQNIRQFGFWSHAAAALSLHAGATNIGWVWNFTQSRSEDDQAVEALAVEYAEYCTQNQFWITNGADWYVTYGDTTDWAYGAHGVFDFTLEVSNSKQPPANQLPQIISDHLPAMNQFVLWPHWFSATIIDADTQLPVMATVREMNKDTTHVGEPNGQVSLLFPEEGTYELMVESPGYASQTITVTSGQTLGTVELQATGLSNERIDTPIFTADGFHTFQFDTSSAQLLSEGQEPITLGAVGEQWRFDSSGTRPGPYHLEHDRGITKNALLLVSPTPHTQITNLTENGTVLGFTVSNELGKGARAWGVHSAHRNLIPLELNGSDLNFEIELPVDGTIDRSLIFLHSSGDIIPLAEAQLPQDTGDLQDSATDSGLTEGPNEPSNSPTNEPSEENSAPTLGDEQESLKAGCQTVPLQLPFVLPLLLLGIRRR